MLFMLCPSFGLVYAKSLLFGIPCLVEYTLFLIGLPRQYLKHRLCVVPFLFETYISYMKKKITALITVANKGHGIVEVAFCGCSMRFMANCDMTNHRSTFYHCDSRVLKNILRL